MRVELQAGRPDLWTFDIRPGKGKQLSVQTPDNGPTPLMPCELNFLSLNGGSGFAFTLIDESL